MSSPDIEHYLPRLEQELPGRILYAKVWGSWSHNTNVPGSDLDFLAVYVTPNKDLLGLRPPTTTVVREHIPLTDVSPYPTYDLHAYEVKKFCDLLIKGNPGIIEALYTERMCWNTADWEMLCLNRSKFMTQRVLEAYKGYAKGQLSRLRKDQSLHTTGGSYNTKWAYHLVRLLLNAKRIHGGDNPRVWKIGTELELLMDIRSGKFSRERIEEMAENILLRLRESPGITLPTKADTEFLNRWLLCVRGVL